MVWFSRKSFNSRIERLLRGTRLHPELSKDGSLLVLVRMERSYCIEIEEYGRFARLTGHPNIGFDPARPPEKVLVNLLLRNNTTTAGAWRLLVADNRVWFGFSHFIPLRFLTRPSFQLGLETVLSEVNQFAFEHRHFCRI